MTIAPMAVSLGVHGARRVLHQRVHFSAVIQNSSSRSSFRDSKLRCFCSCLILAHLFLSLCQPLPPSPLVPP